MNTNEFIRGHISIEINETFSIELKNKCDKLKKYVYYLELIQKNDVSRILYIIQKYGFTWKGYLKSHINKNQYVYYLSILLAEGFIYESDKDEEDISMLKNYYGDYNAKKTTLYKLTKKGKDFIELSDITIYLKKYLNNSFKDIIDQDYEDMMNGEI